MASSKAALEAQVRQKLKGLKKRKKEKRTSDGTWRIVCDSDPRWNAEGTSEVGGDRPPDEMMEKVEELKKKLGTPPPLRYEY
jgi:hypothetical protein